MASSIVLTVTKLNEYANGILSNDPRLRSVRVSGEISGFKRHSSGHLYFNLKDVGAAVRCVMFRSDANALSIIPRDGMRVIVKGSVSIFVREGQYQLYVDSIQEQGEGELYKQFLQLKEKLNSQGVFANKRELPRLPRCIGIATSETGAALRDMLNIIRRRFPKMNILFAHCSVQGNSAPGEITAALNSLQAVEYCDVIIVGRGGGSYEDLFCFNDETVARAIASCKVPIVSAVGHETDYTIADFAADLRAPTPSAAAELCCPVFTELESDICAHIRYMYQLLHSRLDTEKRGMARLMDMANVSTPARITNIYRERLLYAIKRMEGAAHTALMEAERQYDGFMHRLAALNPYNVLKRGYSIITDENGDYLASTRELAVGMNISIRLTDGSAKAVINTIEGN